MDMPSLSKTTAERLLNGHVIGLRAGLRVLRLSGDGVRDYLQGQITQDMRRLSRTQGIHACLLTPQGKPVSELYLFDGGDALWMVVPASRMGQAVARLRRFSLGYALDIAPADELALASVQGSDAESALRAWRLAIPDGGWLACAQDAQKRLTAVMPATPRGFWVIAAREALLGICADHPHTVAETELEAMRIIRGLPRFGVDWDERVHPLNANLIELDGVSFDKGCYVGQEVTSRMRWRGGIRKRLYHVRTAAPPVGIPTPVFDERTAIGTLTSAAIDHQGQCFGIAWLPIATVDRGNVLHIEDATEVEILDACHW